MMSIVCSTVCSTNINRSLIWILVLAKLGQENIGKSWFTMSQDNFNCDESYTLLKKTNKRTFLCHQIPTEWNFFVADSKSTMGTHYTTRVLFRIGPDEQNFLRGNSTLTNQNLLLLTLSWVQKLYFISIMVLPFDHFHFHWTITWHKVKFDKSIWMVNIII